MNHYKQAHNILPSDTSYIYSQNETTFFLYFLYFVNYIQNNEVVF